MYSRLYRTMNSIKSSASPSFLPNLKSKSKNNQHSTVLNKAILRASSLHLSPFAFASQSPIFALLPVLTVHRDLHISLVRKPKPSSDLSDTHSSLTYPHSYHTFSSKFNRITGMANQPCILKATASFSSGSSSEGGKEILVQHLLVKEDDQKLLLELQKRATEGEDLSDLAAEYSICPSKEEGGMLGWVRKGQMMPEFEEAAFNASLNKVVRCKTKFGWHLLKVLSEREELVFEHIQPSELHEKMQDPSFLEEAQLIDVREPHEVPGVTDGKAAGMEVIAVPYLPKQTHLFTSADEVVNSLLDPQLEKWGLPAFEDWIEGTLPLEPWHIGGAVIKGFGRGSKVLGIPTANLSAEGFSDALSEHPSGVYFGWAGLENRGIYKMVMSIGWNPYFNNSEKTIEPWLLHDFDKDFYGEDLRLVVVGYIRPETNFSSLESLVAKIHEDRNIAEKALEMPIYLKHRDDPYLKHNG